MHDDKPGHAFAVTLHDDFPDPAKPLRGFHIDDSASD
jgi:hypothetical protein